MADTAYVSTAIPYVNAKPHLGFALEIVQADAIARYQRLRGRDTFFMTGSDENSLKNVRAAEAEGVTTRELCDRNAQAFQALLPGLNIDASYFIRTSTEMHFKGAQKLWAMSRPEDIYKKHYTGQYCVGCEEFYTEKEAPNGICPEHERPLETVEEENYFFRLTNYQDRLLDLIESGKMRILPAARYNETVSFIRSGLQDFSISRSKQRAGGWGIPVPGDPEQVMYVWYDALANYITGLDFENEGEAYQKYWADCPDKTHVIGKGINRFHTVYWPAMLMSSRLPTPDMVFIHGYLTIEGMKISKSLGNVIDPLVQAEKYGIDAVRYYLLRAVSPYADGDYSEDRMRDVYNADLANNLGNLSRRVETLSEKAGYAPAPLDGAPEAPEGFHEAMADYRFNDAVGAILGLSDALNQRIEEVKPWELQKAGNTADLEAFLGEMVDGIRRIGYWVTPFIPGAASQMAKTFAGGPVKRGKPLFPRIQ